jgi:hypothetical protein
MLEKYRTIFLKIPSYSTQPKLRFLPLAIIWNDTYPIIYIHYIYRVTWSHPP